MTDYKLKTAALAYENPAFLNSPDGRILRLLTEVRQNARASGSQVSTSQLANDTRRAEAAVDMARYYEDARRLARLLTEWSTQIPAKRHRFVVTTGGGPGIMEAAN